MLVRPFETADEDAVVALWERCGLTRPWNDPRKDIRRKMRVRPDHFLVGVVDGEIAATVMVGYEGHRGWIQYLGVDPRRQRTGLGRAIVVEAERLLARRDARRSTSRCACPTPARSSSTSAWGSPWTTWSAWASGWNTTGRGRRESAKTARPLTARGQTG